MKRLTDFHLRKNLAESLILSKIDFAITIYGNYMQQFHCKHLQKLINNTAGFACNRHANVNDVIKLKWVLCVERISFCSSKVAFKLVNDNTLVDYLSLNFKNPLRKLRNCESDLCSINPKKHEKDFATKMSKYFNELPIKVRQSDETYQFIKESKQYYLDKGVSKI